MPTQDDALALASRGWAVLPLRGKVPLTAHGVKDATTDLAQVAAWWPDGARHNIGARVPAQLLVIDVDPQNGGSVEAIEEAAGTRLPATLTVHSGRGTGGQHRYFLHPGGVVSSTRLPTGVDVKTSAGYCVMPPSLHPETGRPYRWEAHEPVAVPPQLRTLLRPRVLPTPVRTPARATGKGRLLVAHVERLQEGGRNAGLYWAACRAAEEGASEALFADLLAAAVRVGLSEAEASRTIQSARRTTGGGA